MEARARGERPDCEEVRRVRSEARADLINRWEEQLSSPAAGRETVEAIRPHLTRWLERRWGVLSYRLVQVLTGHGCFGKYLHQIAGREATPACRAVASFCDSEWESDPQALSAVVAAQ
ncbi:uncharacterized protein LOC142987847 [Anticarsia gemmatalis]|uniref:uncharacterized protein LOC142987847 n=1 Tax=Anticarsia gemmatalis TaxID=129554 RepID=UPI003F75FE9E